MYLEINGKKIGPYRAIKKSSGEVKGDILPILYDNATIELSNSQKKYSLCYKTSKNLFGKDMIYADLVDESSGETFSFQVSNIFLLKIIDNDIKMIAKVGEELKFFSDFGRKQINIESDGDKVDLTPLGYYDIYITYDNSYFYPLFLDGKNHKSSIKKFYDYYGFRAFEDDLGNKHFYMLIEHSSSSEQNPIWYFVDNFEIISEKLYFDDYVEVWDVDEDGDIYMETTNLNKYYIKVGKSTKIVKGTKSKKVENISKQKNIFTFTRVFEDTDNSYIVGKREEGYFIISKLNKKIYEDEQENIVYYKDFIDYDKTNKFFVMKSYSGEVEFLNIFGEHYLTTDLVGNEKIDEIKVSDNKKVVSVKISGEESSREYIL